MTTITTPKTTPKLVADVGANVGDPQLDMTPPSDDISSLIMPEATRPTVSLKKRIVSVRIGKPPKHGFARVHPDKSMCSPMGALDMKDDNELWFVMPNMYEALGGYISKMWLFTSIDTAGNVFFWSLKEPQDGRRGDWFDSALQAITVAKEQWVQIKWNWATKGYDVFNPQGNLPDPKWPDDLEFKSLLKIATRDKIISDMSHVAVRKVLGISN